MYKRDITECLICTIFRLLEKGVWCKIKTKGGPFPIRGHRAVRVSIHFKIMS